MKIMIVAVLVFLLSIFFLTGCTNGDPQKQVQISEKTQTSQTQADVGDVPTLTAENSGDMKGRASNGKLKTILELSDEWARVYDLHKSAFDAAVDANPMEEGPKLLPLISADLPIVDATIYEMMLNSENKEGRFEGNVSISENAAKGMIEKKGNTVSFESDVLLKEGHTSTSGQVGDRKVEKGVYEIDEGCFSYELFLERNGKKLTSTLFDCKNFDSGSFMALSQYSADVVLQKKEKNNYLLFFIMSEEKCEFVSATGKIGLSLGAIKFSEDMTIDQAKKLFETAGCTIQLVGSVKDGKLVMN